MDVLLYIAGVLTADFLDLEGFGRRGCREQILKGIAIAKEIMFDYDELVKPYEDPGEFETGQWDVTTAGVPEQLPALKIPAGKPLILVAKPGNTSDTVYFANSEDKCKATGDGIGVRFDKLEKGDSVALPVSNANKVWVDVETDGDGVSFYAGQ